MANESKFYNKFGITDDWDITNDDWELMKFKDVDDADVAELFPKKKFMKIQNTGVRPEKTAAETARNSIQSK